MGQELRSSRSRRALGRRDRLWMRGDQCLTVSLSTNQNARIGGATFITREHSATPASATISSNMKAWFDLLPEHYVFRCSAFRRLIRVQSPSPGRLARVVSVTSIASPTTPTTSRSSARMGWLYCGCLIVPSGDNPKIGRKTQFFQAKTRVTCRLGPILGCFLL